MTVSTAVDDQSRPPRECWCCGCTQDPNLVVHLGRHPQVAVCLQCAHFLSKRAAEVEDLSRTGAAVRVRNGLRRVRAVVIQRGWHQHPLLGRPPRWLGRHTP